MLERPREHATLLPFVLTPMTDVSTPQAEHRIDAAIDYIDLVISCSEQYDFLELQNERLTEVRKLLTGETTRERQEREAFENNLSHFRRMQSRWHTRLLCRLTGCLICAHSHDYR